MAGFTYDIECLLSDLETILTTKLGPKLTAIAAEKTGINKALDLPLPAADDYYFQTWDDAILNSSPAILYGLRESAAEGVGPATAERITAFVEVYFTNPINEIDDGSGVRRILRYTRAIKEIIQENFDENSILSKLKVKTITPLSFRLEEDTSNEIKVGGVELETSLV